MVVLRAGYNWKHLAVAPVICVAIFHAPPIGLAQEAPPIGLVKNAAQPHGTLASGPIQADAGLIEAPQDSIPDVPNQPSFLSMADVIASVYRSFPEINQARQEYRLADGQLLGAYGSFDTKVGASSVSEPTGFYRNYRNGITAARQTWWGGEVSAGYRIGRGVFQPWYRERETEKGGEFRVGWIQPLLRGRAIDPQRFTIFQASLARHAANPILQEAILRTSRRAVLAYWNWVAAGATLQAQRDLLDLAEIRGEQYQAGFKAGKFAEIDVILNKQLIAERRANLFDAERKFRECGFKLSIFLRDESGQLLVPEDQWLPTEFPPIGPLPPTDVEEEISLALKRRPEPHRLKIELRQLNLDCRLAQNQMLPQLDFVVSGSQDIGPPGTSSDDKGPFELVIGAASEVPIQRRKARGKLRETAAKIAQVSEKLRLQQDKISVEVRTALVSLALSAKVVHEGEVALKTALDTLERYRFAFERGKIDLIYLNLLETKANESQIKLIEAQRLWLEELADLQAAAGLDPLDQAEFLSQLQLQYLLSEGETKTGKPNLKTFDKDE